MKCTFHTQFLTHMAAKKKARKILTYLRNRVSYFILGQKTCSREWPSMLSVQASWLHDLTVNKGSQICETTAYEEVIYLFGVH